MSNTAGQSLKPRSALTLVGAVLILVSGVIHLILSPEHFEKVAYLGLLFLVETAGAVVAAIGVYRGHRWGWVLGALIALGTFVLYFVDALVGLPAKEAERAEGLLEPLGVVAKVVEFLFLLLFVYVFGVRGGMRSHPAA